MVMNVYVATKFSNTEGFLKAKTLLEAAGHKITHDWSKEDASKVPEDKRAEYLTKCAATDVIGVYMADVIIFIPTEEHTAGAFVELGLAIGMWKRVIIVDCFRPGLRDCIFYHLPQVPELHVHVKTIEEAVALVKPIEVKVEDVKQASVSGNN